MVKCHAEDVMSVVRWRWILLLIVHLHRCVVGGDLDTPIEARSVRWIRHPYRHFCRVSEVLTIVALDFFTYSLKKNGLLAFASLFHFYAFLLLSSFSLQCPRPLTRLCSSMIFWGWRAQWVIRFRSEGGSHWKSIAWQKRMKGRGLTKESGEAGKRKSTSDGGRTLLAVIRMSDVLFKFSKWKSLTKAIEYAFSLSLIDQPEISLYQTDRKSLSSPDQPEIINCEKTKRVEQCVYFSFDLIHDAFLQIIQLFCSRFNVRCN